MCSSSATSWIIGRSADRCLLSTAFPFQGLVVLGVRLEPSDILRSYSAGSLSEAEIQRLYSGARCIVFPSFYEGFGFPIVTALAYGKTLIKGAPICSRDRRAARPGA